LESQELFFFPMEKAIIPHITVQPRSGNATISVVTPMIGTKIMSPIIRTTTIPTTQGFKHRLQEL